MTSEAYKRALARADKVMDAESFAEAIAEYCLELVVAERKATVQRIRERMYGKTLFEVAKGSLTLADSAAAMREHVRAILDEEAAR